MNDVYYVGGPAHRKYARVERLQSQLRIVTDRRKYSIGGCVDWQSMGQFDRSEHVYNAIWYKGKPLKFKDRCVYLHSKLDFNTNKTINNIIDKIKNGN